MTEASQHEELDRAAEGTADETVGVTTGTQDDSQEVVAQKIRDEENAERSKLGRKVKDLESQIERLSSLLQREPEEPTNSDDLITVKDLPVYLQRQEQEKQRQQQAYEKDYTSNFAKIGVEDDDFDLVWKEMLEHHNNIHTGNPSIDAKMNYLAAQNALLKKNTPKNPLKGKGKDVSGVNIPDSTKGSEKAMPKLDPVAEEFVKRMGLSAEWVNNTLSK